MKKIKIGIPRSFTYYENAVFIKCFFSYLNCQVVFSKEPDADFLNNMDNFLEFNYCYPIKLYLSHIYRILCDIDYIILFNTLNNRNQIPCIRKIGLENLLSNYLSQEQILTINVTTNNKIKLIDCLIIGHKLKNNLIKTIISYLRAKNKQKKHQITKEREQIHKLNSLNKKVLVLSHSYIIEDPYIIKEIKEHLKNKQIEVIDPNKVPVNMTKEFAQFFSDKINNPEDIKMMGSLHYLMHQIDGIIYLVSENCYHDSILYSLSSTKNKHIPSIILMIDNINKENNLRKLDIFLDKISGESYE